MSIEVKNLTKSFQKQDEKLIYGAVFTAGAAGSTT